MNTFFSFIHHLFIPSHKNNYRAKLLHSDFLTYCLLIAISFMFLSKVVAQQTIEGSVLGTATNITVEKLLMLTNKQREKYDLPPLSLNPALSQAAEKKAEDMFVKDYWAHYGPQGTTPWEFILSAGYRYEYAGENLAKDFEFAGGIVDAWMDSPKHRENILRGQYSDIGFAVKHGTLQGKDTTLVVQFFATPLATTNSTIRTPRVLSVQKSAPFINLKQFSSSAIYLFMSILLLAIVLDLYWASRLRLRRITGKHIAHLIFIAIMLFSLIATSQGVII
ncbi:MAG TPA: CAP domain-containing protein [Patescibacteria group bacterium]|nr:CAP domain-containing protein [Patescibacteria group bacterium]